DLQVRYKKPLLYGETAIIHTWIEEYNGVKTVYGYEIQKPDGQTAITGTTSHICVDKDTFRPIQFRKAFPAWHKVYEQSKKQG
ncbi:hypothetical protein SB775_29940, partial [Peribacillus sp. SIMBA_075]